MTMNRSVAQPTSGSGWWLSLLALALGAWAVAGSPRAAAETASVSVVRWHHERVNFHLYTDDANERPSGWTVDGEVFRCFSLGTPGTERLYRFRRTDGGGYFYTADGREAEDMKRGGFVEEAMNCALAPDPISGTTALHRHYRPRENRHFYGIDKAEGDRMGLRYEGIVGYVAPPGGSTVSSPSRQDISAYLADALAKLCSRGNLTDVWPLASLAPPKQAAGFRTASVDAFRAAQSRLQEALARGDVGAVAQAVADMNAALEQ